MKNNKKSEKELLEMLYKYQMKIGAYTKAYNTQRKLRSVCK